MRIGITWCCITLAVLAIAACGGSSKSSSANSLSKRAFASQTDSICKQSQAALQNVGSPSSVAELTGALGKVETTLRSDLARFQSLSGRAPSDAETAYGHFTTNLSQFIALLGTIGPALKTNDRAKLVTLEQQLKTLTAQGKTDAKQAGLGPTCSS